MNHPIEGELGALRISSNSRCSLHANWTHPAASYLLFRLTRGALGVAPITLTDKLEENVSILMRIGSVCGLRRDALLEKLIRGLINGALGDPETPPSEIQSRARDMISSQIACPRPSP